MSRIAPPVRWAADIAPGAPNGRSARPPRRHETGTDRGRGEARADLFGKIIRSRPTRATRSTLIPDLDGDGIRNADLIIEAVPGKLETEAEGLWQRRAAHEAGRHFSRPTPRASR